MDTVAVTTAEVTGRADTLAAIHRSKPDLSRVESLLADDGYTGQPFVDGVMERLQAAGSSRQAQRTAYLCRFPKLWIVERSFG